MKNSESANAKKCDFVFFKRRTPLQEIWTTNPERGCAGLDFSVGT